MKAVILAGGLGTRIIEESHLRPKPMIEIGEQPILWHIMKIYSKYNVNEFIICAGYKQHMIKEYFSDYFLRCNNITFDLSGNGKMTVHNGNSEPWKVTIVDTGSRTMTGGRIKRIKEYVDNETFMLTYGDGLSDINIERLLEFHRRFGKYATLTAIRPDSRFGVLDIEDDMIRSFREKEKADVDWINGGFMVLEPEIFDYIEGDDTVFEQKSLQRLSAEGQLTAFKHDGFWQCMDSLRDKEGLDALWATGKAPWKIW